MSCIGIITGVYFCRLKINHESHEFILDPGIVANRKGPDNLWLGLQEEYDTAVYYINVIIDEGESNDNIQRREKTTFKIAKGKCTCLLQKKAREA